MEDISPCGEQEFCPVYAAEGIPIRCHKTRLMEPCIYYGKAICPQLTGQVCSLEKVRKMHAAFSLNDAWH